MPRRLVSLVLAACTLGTPLAVAQEADGTSVESSGAVVVHGVTTGTLGARLKAVDRNIESGETDAAVALLDDLLGEDLRVLHEDSEGTYLRAEDAVLYRLAALPPGALARWRELADRRGAALLARVGKPGGVAALEQGARRLALTSSGPRLLVALADARRLAGDLRGAARILEDLLLLWTPRAAQPPGQTTGLPGVDRASVVSRLAALTSVLGDAAGVRALAGEQAAGLLAGPSPALRGATLADELERAAASAARRTRDAALPRAPLEIVAETRHSVVDLRLPLPDRGREIPARPVATTAPDGRPMLLARIADPLGISSRLHALVPDALGEDRVARLRIAWSWPSEDELRRFPRAPGATPFEPVIDGDLVFLCWPSTRSPDHDGERHMRAEEDELRDLVVLSLSAEGRVVDERGFGEEDRSDGDPEFERLSFCGPPLVRGDAVYVTLAGRSPNGGMSELHVARFDMVRSGEDVRLRLRWRRHVVDGSPIPPSQFSVTEWEYEPELAFPTGMAERFGLLYVGSNTGAVACIDSTDGAVVWLETYRRLGPSPRRAVAEASPVGWKYGPVIADGPRIVVAPRDTERLLVFTARPMRSRTMRSIDIAVRGMGGASEGGSPFGDLMVDELVAVRDGRAYVSGTLPSRIAGAMHAPASPIVEIDLEPGGATGPAEIPEMCSAGGAAALADGIVYPTFKALYGIALGGFQESPTELWRAASAERSRTIPDRLGNVVVAGGFVWSVTPSRIVLFAPR